MVATGASPAVPELPGRDLPGIFGFRKYTDAVAIAKASASAKYAVVLGGGLVGLKAAYAMKRRGLPGVTVLVKSPHLLIKQLDEEAASFLEKTFYKMGVEFIFNTDATAFLPSPDGGRVRAVLLQNGREIPSDIVVSAKGVRPRTGLVAEAGGLVRQGIVVDGFLETNLPDIYAAGDCVEITDVLTEERRPSGLWPLAAEQGRYAARNMLGKTSAYPPALTAQNAVRFGNMSLISAGHRTAKEQVVIRRREPYPGVLKKFYIQDDRLLGYILMGDISKAGLYTAMVSTGRRTAGLAAMSPEATEEYAGDGLKAAKAIFTALQERRRGLGLAFRDW